MVIERFRDPDLKPLTERFQQRGRMLPDGVTYHASWIDGPGNRCFQLMEAESVDALGPWIDRSDDLVEFEIIPVVTSAEFWAQR